MPCQTRHTCPGGPGNFPVLQCQPLLNQHGAFGAHTCFSPGMSRAIHVLAAAILGCAADFAGETARIVISLPDHKLILLEGERVVRVFDIAVGKTSTPSPQGDFQIANRVHNPTWFGPHVVVAPGKANPLGTRWMGLSVAGYGIHGTNVPSSIGKSASHGCIRMRNRDVEELFELVSVGTPVQLLGSTTAQVQKLLANAD
jgi:hypothetical protein